MLDNKDIDQLFADKFKDLSVKPRPELWGSIKGNMKLAKRKKRVAIALTSLAAVASFALLFSLSNHFFIQDKTIFQDPKLLSGLDTNLNRIVEDSKVEKNILENEKAADLSLNNKNKPEANKETIESTPLFKTEPNRNDNLSIKHLNSKTKVLENVSLTMHIPKERIGVNEKVISVTMHDSSIVARNIKLLELFNNSEKRKKGWSILGQVSSAYSSYVGDNSEYNKENGLVSFGGGVKLNWQTSKKIAIQTGFVYNKFGQQLVYTRPVYTTPILRSRSIMGSRSNIGITTSAGHIKLKAPVVYSAANFLSAPLKSSSIDMVQSFEAIEIPLILRYNLIDEKIGLCINGGLSTNFMVGNKVYNKDTGEILGKTIGIRSTNFSTNFSLDIEYELNSKFSLSLEPSLKYYLNSINKDSDFNYKPYTLGFNSGILYKF